MHRNYENYENYGNYGNYGRVAGRHDIPRGLKVPQSGMARARDVPLGKTARRCAVAVCGLLDGGGGMRSAGA